MRIIEVLILAALLIALLNTFRRATDRAGAYLPYIPVAMILLHLTLEGYRWQMVPAYVVALLMFGQGLSELRKRKSSAASRPRKLRVTTAMCGILLLASSGFLGWLFPVFELPAPTGRYAVGTTYLYLVDRSREESFTEDKTDRRELPVQLWYPAERTDDVPLAPYLQDAKKVGRRLAGDVRITEKTHLPPFMFDHLAQVKAHSFPDAPLASEDLRYPVLIFSHGYAQGMASQNTVQMQELASHGYIVASITHPYEALLAFMADGGAVAANRAQLQALSDELGPLLKIWAKSGSRVEQDARFRALVAGTQTAAKSVDLWVADTRFVVDELARLNAERFAGKLDLDRLGVFGMSFGGTTAAQVCLEDPRVKAGINLDGLQLGKTLGQSIRQPFMFMYSTTGVPADMNALVYESAAGPAYQLAIAGTSHVHYSDMALWTNVFQLFGMLDGPRAQRILNAYVLAFFNRHLRGTQEPLLERASSEFPEVKFASRNTGVTQ